MAQMGGRQPILVLNTNTQRESGRKAQLGNIQAAKAVADVVRTCLGPRAMLKMLLDVRGSITMTNDGNTILRELIVQHPAAKSMIELSRAQDEEVGDGTTSVIVLAGEILAVSEPLLERQLHPTVIIAGFTRALEDAMATCKGLCRTLDVNNRAEMTEVVKSCIGTKFVSRWSEQMCNIALDAVTLIQDNCEGKTEIDLKRYARVEKIPGGEFKDSEVLSGVMFQKDVTHSRMSRRIENPTILLLDCTLEYKKGESQTMLEVESAEDWDTILKMEEEYIQKICGEILQHKPDIVITEKGLSDLAQHYFVKAGVTALRRLRSTDMARVAKATGATIVSRTDEITQEDLGKAGLFEVKKIGDEYFTFLVECEAPKACSILLRGASKDVLNEIERNLQDAMHVARNVVIDPRLLPGGGATEMALSHALMTKAKSVEGVAQWPYKAIAIALEVIPRTLAQNCGAKTVRVLTELRAKHAQDPKENSSWGIDGDKGTIVNMKDLGVWEPYAVKVQTIKTSIEAACMLLRVDEIVSGLSGGGGGGRAPGPPGGGMIPGM
eukprot:TRINITY_DN3961_c3_g1_i1.p1 TRINITY_DN3961_c3_g1~~TRINITY_DN3961_c3_g1_i1.p1  ORF type:complete len:572 (+),score=193.67 TRINITY_DN3961_c3_g1_i1:61-1716(+)